MSIILSAGHASKTVCAFILIFPMTYLRSVYRHTLVYAVDECWDQMDNCDVNAICEIFQKASYATVSQATLGQGSGDNALVSSAAQLPINQLPLFSFTPDVNECESGFIDICSPDRNTIGSFVCELQPSPPISPASPDTPSQPHTCQLPRF